MLTKSLLIKALRKNQAASGAPESEIDASAIRWFNLASDRGDGRKDHEKAKKAEGEARVLRGGHTSADGAFFGLRGLGEEEESSSEEERAAGSVRPMAPRQPPPAVSCVPRDRRSMGEEDVDMSPIDTPTPVPGHLSGPSLSDSLRERP
ncbi:hypothetical protein DPEC_G00178420 [Dallia pectoralis]|uniref:Uncharacterized protein n=1 Tax=Dallia pectoralis TaxID=75939 RepID=A0ACC2GF97_DALPE|nr:hypothetical protein DPEC_G00178420 [Dallia pectoralis]